MKNSLLLFMSLLAIVSCNKALPLSDSESFEDKLTWGEITVGIAPENLTKSSSSAAETTVKSLQVFVFDKNNLIVAYSSSNTDKLELNVPLNNPGYVVYAVANCPDDLSKVAGTSELNSSVARLSSDSREHLQMIGHTEAGISFTKGAAIEVPVKRFAAKIEIDNIKTAFTNYNHKISDFELKGIYLINVNGTCPFSMEAVSGSQWYNKFCYVQGDCEELLADYFQTSFFLQTQDGVSHPYGTAHYFYAYPNPVTEDNRGKTWSPRRTRLVVETALGSNTYYYPIDIYGDGDEPVISSNCLYRISQLTITGLGTYSPDDVLEKGTVNFNLTILDWETGSTRELTY